MLLLSSITVWTLVFSVRRVPPHFSIPPEDVEVTPGGSVNITCVAVGSPMPYVKWRLGAIELTPEDSIPIGKNVLMLNNVLESANYTCVATSDLGNIDAVAKVKVKGSRWRSNSSLCTIACTCSFILLPLFTWSKLRFWQCDVMWWSSDDCMRCLLSLSPIAYFAFYDSLNSSHKWFWSFS